MKKLVFIIALTSAAVCFAEAAAQLSDVEKEARRAELMKRTGGPIKLPAKGFVALVDYQNRVPFEKLEEKFKGTFEGFGIEAKAIKSDEPFSIENFVKTREKLGAGSVVFVVDQPDLPMSLVSIESRSGLVNVGALDSDKPSPALLSRRTGKIIGRIAMLASGGAESEAPTSDLQTVTNLAELDANEGQGDEVYVMMGVIRGLAKAGVVAPRRMTYKQACKIGEAPAPTNEYQKAIWEQTRAEINQKPSNPIRILPGQKPSGTVSPGQK